MDDFQLTTGQIASLKALHRLQRDRKKAYRVNAVVLLGRGWSVAQVAEALLVDEKTVRIWYEKYLHGGEGDSRIFGQCELLHCPRVEGKVEENEDCVTLFAGLFTEFEFDRTIMEVFQEEYTVQ